VRNKVYIKNSIREQNQERCIDFLVTQGGRTKRERGSAPGPGCGGAGGAGSAAAGGASGTEAAAAAAAAVAAMSVSDGSESRRCGEGEIRGFTEQSAVPLFLVPRGSQRDTDFFSKRIDSFPKPSCTSAPNFGRI
jgi:hypothetical protein